MPENADAQIRLYGLLTDQLGKYSTITWQVPTGLVAANILAIDRLESRPMVLGAIGLFNAVIIFAFYKMVARQRAIIESARQAEDILVQQYPGFIPRFAASKLRAPSLIVYVLLVLDILLVGHAAVNVSQRWGDSRRTVSAGVSLRQNMTMLEVEQVLGKPDRVEVEEGKVEGALEHPKVIRWIYSRYRVTDSGDGFGSPGHVSFVPVRFTKLGWNDEQGDRTAREYGEQADSFRTLVFRGSFPIDPIDRRDLETAGGLFDFIPLKELKK